MDFEQSTIGRTLARISANVRSPGRALRAVMVARRQMVLEAFATSGSSTGAPWSPLEPQYRAIQRAHNDSLVPLQTTARTGRLVPSFSGGPEHIFTLGDRQAVIGSRVPWAAHVARGGTNPMTGEQFQGRNPLRLGPAQVDELTGIFKRELAG